MHESAAQEVLGHYALTPMALTPLLGGLINNTFRVDAKEGAFVLQALHPIFRPEVHIDIDVVTQHLRQKGMTTPELVRTKSGALYVIAEHDKTVWRVMTYLPSVTHERVKSPQIAAAGGELVGRFHLALADLRHDFAFKRQGVHDTAKHFAALHAAVQEFPTHRYVSRILRTAEEIEAAQKSLPVLELQQTRIAHGDLKITNLLFDKQGHGLCLIDLDTLAMMPLAHEMGDAWRSWCNPGGEDDENAHFDLALFEASAHAYLRTMAITQAERQALVAGTATIALELAARFCADALRETYFGWNAKKFPDRSTHNWVRAQSQLRLHQSIMQQRALAERIVSAV